MNFNSNRFEVFGIIKNSLIKGDIRSLIRGEIVIDVCTRY